MANALIYVAGGRRRSLFGGGASMFRRAKYSLNRILINPLPRQKHPGSDRSPLLV